MEGMINSRRIWRHFMGKDRIDPWEPQILDLTAIEVPDVIPDSRGPLMFSERLVALLQTHLNPGEDIEWLPATIRHPSAGSKDYFYPFFEKWPDVVHVESSTFSSRGDPIRWSLDCSKIRGLTLFPSPDRYALRLFVSESAREAMIAEKVSGCLLSLAGCH